MTAGGQSIHLTLPATWVATVPPSDAATVNAGSPLVKVAADFRLGRPGAATGSALLSVFTSVRTGRPTASELTQDARTAARMQHGNRLGGHTLTAAQTETSTASVAGEAGVSGSFTDDRPSSPAAGAYRFWALRLEHTSFTLVLGSAAGTPSPDQTIASAVATGPCP